MQATEKQKSMTLLDYQLQEYKRNTGKGRARMGGYFVYGKELPSIVIQIVKEDRLGADIARICNRANSRA